MGQGQLITTFSHLDPRIFRSGSDGFDVFWFVLLPSQTANLFRILYDNGVDDRLRCAISGEIQCRPKNHLARRLRRWEIKVNDIQVYCQQVTSPLIRVDFCALGQAGRTVSDG